MRKIMLTVVATCAIAIIPATALAHGHGKRDDNRHHHRGHHAQIHHKQFGHDWGQSGSTSSSNPSFEQNAGTVQSFMNGVLTIALNNGQTVSGQVTGDTEIECRAPETPGFRSHDRGDGDNNGDNSGDDHGDDNNNDNEEAQNCDMSALTATAVVHEARLRLSGAGA